MFHLRHLNPLNPIKSIVAYSAQLDKTRQALWENHFTRSCSAIHNPAVTLNRQLAQRFQFVTLCVSPENQDNSLSTGTIFTTLDHRRVGACVTEVRQDKQAPTYAEGGLGAARNGNTHDKISDQIHQSVKYSLIENLHRHKHFLKMAEQADRPEAISLDPVTLEAKINKAILSFIANRDRHSA